MENLSNNQLNQNNEEEIRMINDEEFIKEQEEGMEEMREHNAGIDKMIKELEEERIDGMREMKEHNEKIDKLIEELEEERKDGEEEMRESLKENKVDKKEVKQQAVVRVVTENKIKPPMNMSNVSNEVVQKQDINKRKNALKYLLNAKDSITRTLNCNAKLHWSKEEITLLRRVRALSNELGAIIDTLKIIPKQQEEMREIQQQLVEQPIENIKVEYAKSGEFSIINIETKVIETTGNKDEIKGYLKGLYTRQ